VQPTAFPNLHLLPAGPPGEHPAETAASARVAQLVGAANHDFDFVLLDTPSFLGVADAASLATKVDGVLLVVSRGRAKEADVASTLAELDDIQANLVGLVVTRSARKPPSYGGETGADRIASRLQVVNE
jgi:non-specific protein-tyrosine kinase